MKSADHDATRERVARQYERFPYPTPQHDLRPFREGQALELGFPSVFFHRYWPREAYREDLDILVAGCGSTQAARYAAAHPRAKVTGIDLSETSLEHSRRLAREFDLQNLDLKHLAVEDADQLDGPFDLIVSTGVIHHLPEPEAGLRALRPLLRPEGAMHVMLYAPYGRDAIYYLQDLMQAVGITVESITDEDVEALVRLVDTLPTEHPLWHRRRHFPDLRNGAELVDYLLHPQDRAFSLRDSRELLSSCGFELQDVFNRAYYSPRSSGLTTLPLLEHVRELGEFEQFEIGEIYRASISRHDLIVCRDDRPRRSRRIDFDEPRDEVVPVPMPGVQVTPESPPQGKAAWLQWPAHGLAGIRLAVDEEELAFFRASDGAQSVKSILEGIEAPGLVGEPERVSALLADLFDHDLAWLKSVPAGSGSV